jgi:chorismate mutase-like protein
MWMRLGAAWLVLLASCICVGPGVEEGELPSLVAERLSWMDEVAMVKKAQGLPVADREREAALLRAMEVEGKQAGLPRAAVRGFFSGQIEAAKARQEDWLRAHSGDGRVAGRLPDLGGTVRPELDAIGRRMIGALRQARGGGNACCLVEATRDRLAAEGYSQKVIAAAVGGLEAGLVRD